MSCPALLNAYIPTPQNAYLVKRDGAIFVTTAEMQCNLPHFRKPQRFLRLWLFVRYHRVIALIVLLRVSVLGNIPIVLHDLEQVGLHAV